MQIISTPPELPTKQGARREKNINATVFDQALKSVKQTVFMYVMNSRF